MDLQDPLPPFQTAVLTVLIFYLRFPTRVDPVSNARRKSKMVTANSSLRTDFRLQSASAILIVK
jgi:hypothetical protein